MHIYFHDEKILYTGEQLSSLWAYKNFGLQGDSIVCFRGPCRVTLSEMVDVEDVLAGDTIFGPDMLHFIIEHFDHDLEKAVLRQRMLISIIKDKMGLPNLIRVGDDLFVEDSKFSVSIATVTPVSTMIHTALNVVSQGTPVKTVGFCDLGYSEEAVRGFGLSICELYKKEMASVRLACCKVRGVG